MADTSRPAPQVPPSRPRKRHGLVGLSFLLMVLLPPLVAGWYLWTRAADRYTSTVGVSVRTEETNSALEMLGGIAELSGSSSTDTEILYKFIQSQELVRRADLALDLRGLWAKGNPALDPVFVYTPPGTIEDLVDYWSRMVKVYNDDTGLLELHVQAFTPEDAQRIAQFVFDESAEMINRLTAIARDDATSYAREELDQSQEALKTAREAMTRFRNRTQIVDPTASVQSQMGLLSSLQLQLAETLINLDILRQTAAANDPRITQAERRVEVIENRMVEEREKLGLGAEDVAASTVFADLVGEFERLNVEREFAEQSYTAARAAYDAALAEARRKSRYLAAHIRPTLAEAPEHPRRLMLTFLTGMFAFLIWAILVLAFYAVRDRR